MQYITILGRTSEVNDASYTDKRSGEIVPRTELLLEIPGLRDKVRCELPRDGASDPQADLERWELEESWVVVEASELPPDGLRPFERASWRERLWGHARLPGGDCP